MPPCDSIQLMEVQLDKMNPDHLMEALKEMGWDPSQNKHMIYLGSGEYINTLTGESRLNPGTDVTKIKMAYTEQVIKAKAKEAKRYGWTLKKVSATKYQLIKRK